MHQRTAPTRSEFAYPMSCVWIDPDRPQDLCDLHPAWSSRRPSLARFRRKDYGPSPTGSLSGAARRDLAPVLGYKPHGPVRMLSQMRRWGWLFNPITVVLVWDGPDDSESSRQRPSGAVLEVTNTPWKERTRYAVALDETAGRLTAVFDKSMHVSPFLGLDHRYRLSLEDRDDRISLAIDVIGADGAVALHTALQLSRQRATRELLGRSLRTTPVPTHRVSTGIHTQALRLWAKRVPLVPHPKTIEDPL